VLPLPSALRAAVWGAVMVASFVGWGTLVAMWLAPGERVDWGLRAGWGLAAFILPGGFLCLAHLAMRVTLILHVGLGVVALMVARALEPPQPRSWADLRRRARAAADRPAMPALLFAAYAAAVFTFFSFLGDHGFQPSDDRPFYFVLAEKLVQTGSMFEPFAGRRVTVLGGQVYLHASFISVASIYYLHVVDGGISQLIVIGLIVGQARRQGPILAQALGLGLALLVLFTLREVRINTTSHGSSLAVMLTLYRTVRIRLESEAEPARWPMEPRRIVALSALALTSILLRVSNGPAALLFVAMVVCFDWLRRTARPWTWRSPLSLCRAGALSSTTLLVGLLPWSLLQHQSTGSFFYPLGHSNLTPGWTLGLEATHGLWQEATALLADLSYGRPLTDFSAFVLAGLGLVLLSRSVRAAPVEAYDVAAFSIASFVAFAIFSRNAVAFGPHHVARYCYAFIAATGVIVALSVDGWDSRAALVGAAIAYHVGFSVGTTYWSFREHLAGAARAFGGDRQFTASTSDYADIQSKIPPGATMATAVFEGFRFDFERNPIFALDVLGGMGPNPGWPTKRGPKALRDYLVSNGIQYLVWVDFNLKSEFYNRAHWKDNLQLTGTYLQPQAVLLLDAEDSIERLSAKRGLVYRAHGMTVVDLTAGDAPAR
jgi:hypothetical protein